MVKAGVEATDRHKQREQRMDMNLPKLIEQFGSEDRCRTYLERLRWPDGPKCPRCGDESISRIQTRSQFDCNSCRYRFSVTAGTVFHDSHLKLWKWFLATYMMCESRKGISANQLKRTLGVSYKTAWYLCHRIRFSMVDASVARLSGTVEVDETFIGGKRRNQHVHKRDRKRMSGTDDKTMVVGAMQRGGPIRLHVELRPNSGPVLKGFVHETVDESARIYTDQNAAYAGLANHESVNHGADEWVRGDVSTQNIESAWSLFKRSIVGSYHQLSVKHLNAYLDEFSFRFNNRENPYLFRDTLIKLCEADALPYKVLVKTAN